MIKLERTSVMNLENAMRGARNPLNSWTKSDSYYNEKGEYVLGENDLSLATRLCKAGSDHRKFIRQIMVSVDITAPLYWWKEYDTYKVGTVANSTSTMHTIHKKPMSLDNFSVEHLRPMNRELFQSLVNLINLNAEEFKKTGDKEAWWQIIQMLPASFNQMRTVTLNYEVLTNIYHARKAHKLDEWHTFCDWIRTLPYHQLITGEVPEECQE